MTRASPARRQQRRRKDYSADRDVAVAEIAIILKAAWGLSERQAVDLALALIDGEPVAPSKLPRGGRRHGGILVGYRLVRHASFAGRNATIRRKLKHANLIIVRAAIALLALQQ
jgi:hypothetical protein